MYTPMEKKWMAGLWVLMIGMCLGAKAQLTTGPTPGAAGLANLIAGTGVTVTNAVLNCAGTANGTFDGTASNLGMPTGVILTNGRRQDAPGPDSDFAGPGASTNNGTGGYAPLNAIAGAPTQDACVLEFDVESRSSYLEFRYVFGSEEYPDFVNSAYNDAFAFFISGPGIAGVQNIALIPGTAQPVTINNVNAGRNAMYFRNNAGGATIEYNGLTTVLTAFANVIPCKKYHLVLAIADANDGIYDSGIFIEEASLTAPPLAVDSTTTDAGLPHVYEGCYNGKFHFSLDKPALEDFAIYYSIKGNAENGVDYEEIIDSVIVPKGDSTAFVEIIGIKDTLVESNEYVILCALDFCDKTELSCDTLWIHDFYGEAEGDTTICFGDSTMLLASGSDSVKYRWTPATSLNNDTIANPIAKPTAPTTTYIVEIYNNYCSMYDTVVVNLEQPQLVVTGDTIFCPGGTAQLGAEISNVWQPENADYLWSPAQYLNVPNDQNPLATPDTSKWFHVTATSVRGCEASDSVFVEHYQVPDAEAGLNDTVCGFVYGLNASPSIGLGTWTSNNPLVNFYGPNDANATVVVPTDGVYTFYWTEDNFGCTDMDSVMIEFIDLPPAEAGPGGSTCGNVFNLNATPTTGNGTWSANDLNGNPIPVNFSPSRNDPNVIATSPVYDSLIFTWSVDLVVCVSEDTNLVAFYEIPNSYAGEDDTLCGIDYDLQAIPSVGQGTWTCIESGSIIFTPDANDPNANAQAPSFGTYSFIWTENNYGCIDQDTVQITFSDTPSPDAGTNDSICGLSNSLNATTSFGVGSWSPSIGLADPNDPNTSVTAPGYGCYTYYWSEIFNQCTGSDSVTLCFFETPLSEAGPNDTVCGTTGSLSASPSVGVGQWTAINAGATTINNPNNPNTIVSLSGAYETYGFIWSENNVICSDQDTSYITFYEIPVAEAGTGDSICGVQGLINAIPSVGTGVWTSDHPGISFTSPNNPSQSINISALGYGTYTFYWTETNAICSSVDSVKLSFFQIPNSQAGVDDSICSDTYTLCASPSVGQGQWTSLHPGANFSNGSSACTQVQVNNYGVYQFVFTETNVICQDQDTVEITFFETPVSQVQADDSICGLTYTIQAFPSVGVGSWTCSNNLVTISNPGNSTTQVDASNVGYGTYTFTWTERNDKCADSASVNITFIETPQSQVSNDTAVCGLTATARAFPSQGLGQWYALQPGTNIAPNANAANITVTADDYGTYTLVWFEDNLGCTDSDTIEITFHEIPDANAGLDGQICGLEFQMGAIPSVGQGLWTGPSGVVFSDPNDPNTFVNSNTYDTLIFVWTETNAFCSDSDTMQIIFYDHPTAQFTQSDDTLCTDDRWLYFEDQSLLANTYAWSFGDGGTSVYPDPQHEYQELGEFEITLVVSDLFGCKDTATSSVFIDNCWDIFIPNAFTPNGDNINDVFSPSSYGIRDTGYRFTIFDRWGKVVFQTLTPNLGWSGLDDLGKPFQQGNYAFEIKFTTFDDVIHLRTGSVTLVR